MISWDREHPLHLCLASQLCSKDSTGGEEGEYQDYNVVLPVFVEVFHQRGEGGKLLGIEGEVPVPVHVINVIPLCILQNRGSGMGDRIQTPPPQVWGVTWGIW